MLTNDDFIKILVALVSVLLGFALCRVGDWLNVRRLAKKERLDRLFNPLTALYWREHRGSAVDFSELDEKARAEFMKILADNSVYADKYLSEIMYEFFASIGTQDISDCLQEDETRRKLDCMYNSITHYAFLEWTKLTNQLYWPWYSRVYRYFRYTWFKNSLNKKNRQNRSTIYWT